MTRMDGNRDKYQTGDGIDYKPSFITRTPEGKAPGTYCILCPLSCQSLVPKLHSLKTTLTGVW